MSNNANNYNYNQNKRSSDRRRGGKNRYENNDQNKTNNAANVKDEFDLDDIDFQLILKNFDSINLDFSAFPLLLEETYSIIKNFCYTSDDNIPFCVYQHAMTVLLNQKIVSKKHCDVRPRHIRVLKPIKYYIDEICTKKSPNGYNISLKLPNAAIPQESIKDDNGKVWIPAGSFGPITAENHNSYECYASPLVSRRLIEQTIYANENDDFGPWNPLPSGAYPAGAVCTSNLIGYRIPEKLTSEQLEILKSTKFDDDDKYIHCYFQDINRMVNHLSCNAPSYFADISNFNYGESRIGMIGYLEVIPEKILDYKQRLIDMNAHLYSHEKLRDVDVEKSIITGLRRRRNIQAPGYCMVKSNGEPIEGWENTMNDNFEMKGLFSDNGRQSLKLMQGKRFCCSNVSLKNSMEKWIHEHIRIAELQN